MRCDPRPGGGGPPGPEPAPDPPDDGWLADVTDDDVGLADGLLWLHERGPGIEQDRLMVGWLTLLSSPVGARESQHNSSSPEPPRETRDVAPVTGWVVANHRLPPRCRSRAGNNPEQTCITVAVFLSVTALQLSVAHDSSGAATYRHLLSVGPVQAASAARRVL